MNLAEFGEISHKLFDTHVTPLPSFHAYYVPITYPCRVGATSPIDGMAGVTNVEWHRVMKFLPAPIHFVG